MNDSEQIIDELKHIECASDHVLDRIIGVLEHHNPNGEYQIVSHEDTDFIHDNVRVYNAFSEDQKSPSIAIVVKEGMDHYVAKVVAAYELQ